LLRTDSVVEGGGGPAGLQFDVEPWLASCTQRGDASTIATAGTMSAAVHNEYAWNVYCSFN
jgi:hypothetical protein